MSSTPSRLLAAAVGDAALSGSFNYAGIDAISVAGAFDYDFNATSSVPIGLQALPNWTCPIGDEKIQRVTDIGAGIFYTGRKDLSTGIQLIVRCFAARPEVDVSWSTVLAQLGLRYYF